MMTKFADTIAQVIKNLVTGPIGAQDMNAGEVVVQRPDKQYGRDEDADLYREDEELDKSVVPQHYIPGYGKVKMLSKSGPPALVIKASDELRDDITDREIVVGGYSSPQVIDREKHLITKEAMAKDLPRFLAEPLYANAMILHSNVQVGQVLSEWQHPDTGKVYRTQVDDIGLFCVIRLRTDKYRPKIVDKVLEDIEKGNLKAFSISGDAPLDSREHKCDGGECFWVIPAIEFYEITICEEGVNQGAKLMILAKSCSDGRCGLVQKQPVPEGEEHPKPEPTPQAALPAPEATPGFVENDADETKEKLTERVGEIADEVGEDDAVELVSDVADAAEKLENVAGTGIGSGGSGDANTMGDFGKPYSRDTAVMKGDPSIDRFFQAYRTFLARGASPEDAYFKLLEDGADGEPAPPWFGTRDGKFRQFLIQAHHSGLPIPTIKLRMQGNKEGEIVADPELMAWDLLQTAINRTRATLDKDVSPVEHEHTEDGPVPLPRPGLVDERGIPQEECNGFTEWEESLPQRTLDEPEESESYYLNLALKSLNKADSTLGAVAGSKIHEAYTVAMDGIYRLGHLTTEQRIALSSAITEALDAFHKEIGDMGDLEIPAEDVALLMKDCKPEFHLHAPDFEGPACKDGQGGVEKHKMRDDETHRHKRGVKGAAGVVRKHRDKQGSTAHHQTGGATGGVAAPPPGSVPQEDQQMEERVQTLTAEIKERNAKGASLRLAPGYRDAPYAVTGMDALQRPLRLVGNVADIIAALRENAAEVDELMEQRKVDNYAVPVDVGKVNEVEIFTGDGVSPMELIREQVARASFGGAVAKVLAKDRGHGVRGRDYLMDEKQQVEPENVSVMGGVRVPGNRNQEGHATTEIEQGGDVEGIGGTKVNIGTEPMEQAPPSHGIAQQGAVSPPQGVQGIGETPEFIQVHDDQPAMGVRTENEGTGLDPRADADNRGAPVAHRTQRP